MRAMELAVGVVAGCVMGFLLHEWIAPASAPTPISALRAATDAAPERGEMPMSAPVPAPAVPLPLDPSPVQPALTAPSDSAAADALLGMLVYGAVLDVEGQPVPPGSGRSITFDDGRGRPMSIPLGPSSVFAVPCLRAGKLTVSTNFGGYRPSRAELLLSDAEPVVRLDIVLEPALSLLIRGVTPAGEPLLPATVRAFGAGGGFSWRQLVAIATREPPAGDLPESVFAHERWGIGSFRPRWTDDLPPDVIGRLELDESLPVCVSLLFQHVLLATQRVEPDAQELVFTVSVESLKTLLGTLRVRVIDADTRQPIEGTTAILLNGEGSASSPTVYADGTLSWTGQLPGAFAMRIAAPGHEAWEERVSVPAGGLRDLGLIELTSPAIISGLVVNALGEPVSARVRVLRGDMQHVASGLEAGSELTFGFHFQDLGRRLYWLFVDSDEWAAQPLLVDTRSGDVRDVRITVVPGAVLRVNPLWPVDGHYALHVSTADGIEVPSAAFWRSDRPWTRRLPAGVYTVTLLRDGKELRRVPVTLGQQDLALDIGP